MQHYDRVNIYYTSLPSFSRQLSCLAQSPSLPRVTNDIMDDIKVKKEYNAPPIENFNTSDRDDNDDADGEVNIVQ